MDSDRLRQTMLDKAAEIRRLDPHIRETVK
jgi:hypothetical protein